MTENRAELILAIRDEISAGMAKINAAVGVSKQEIAGLSGAGQQAAAGLSSLKDQAAAAGATITQALAFAGVAVGIYEVVSSVKELYSSILEIGGKQEVLQGANYALGQMYGISKVNLDDMRESLQQLDVPLDTATKGMNSFIKSGLNLGDLPGLVMAVKDIAVSQGKSFTETWDAAIKSVVLGSARGLREIEVNLGDMATVAGKSIKDIENEAGLTASQKSKIMLDALMGYAKQFEGISESATGSYLKQQLKLKNAAEEAKVAMYDSLKPLAMAITGEKIQAWEDLYTWVSANQVALTGYAEGLGVFVGKAANTVKTVLEFTAAHKDLVYTLLEGYGIYKISAAVLVPVGVALYNAAAGAKAFAVAQLATTAVVNPGIAAVAGLGGAATTASTGIAAASGAAVAARGAFAAWIPTIAAVGLALIALGAISIKRQVEKTPSLVGDMLMGEAYGVMSEADRVGMLAGGQDADAKAAAARRLTRPATGTEGQQESWELFQRQQQQKEFEAAMEKVRSQQAAGMPGKGGKGGGKGEAAAENSLENFVSRMKQETARASGEGMAALDAWYGKEAQTLDQLAVKGADVTAGREALDDAYYGKKDKLEKDFNLLVAKESGDAFLENDARYLKDVEKYGDSEAKKAQLLAIWATHNNEIALKNDQESLNRQKDYLSGLAGTAPLLSQQLDLQRQILGVEEQQGKNKLDLDFYTHKITEDEWRGLEALRAQTAEYARQAQERKEWATQGVSGGVKMWAQDRGKEQETRGSTWAMDSMKGAESWLGDTFGKNVYNSLVGQKDQLKQLFQNLMGDAVSWVFKQNAKTLFDMAAGLVPKQGGTAAPQLAMPKLSPIEAKIDAQEVRNLALENRQFTSFGTEIKDFSGGIEKFGTYIQKGDGFYDKYAGQIDQAFPEFKQAATGLQSTVTPITDASGAQTSAAAQSSLSSIAGVGAAAGMTLAAIGMLTGSKELSMAGMVISTAAAILQTAALIMMASDFIPFFHGGGVIYAHDGWPPLKHDERRIIGQTGEGILSREDMSALGGPTGFDAFRRSLRSGGGSAPAPGSPGGGNQVILNIGDIHINPPQGMTGLEAEQMVRRHILPAIEKVVGNRGLSLLG